MNTFVMGPIQLCILVLGYAYVLALYTFYIRRRAFIPLAGGVGLRRDTVATPDLTGRLFANVLLPGLGMFLLGARLEGAIVCLFQLACLLDGLLLPSAWRTVAIVCWWIGLYFSTVFMLRMRSEAKASGVASVYRLGLTPSGTPAT